MNPWHYFKALLAALKNGRSNNSATSQSTSSAKSTSVTSPKFSLPRTAASTKKPRKEFPEKHLNSPNVTKGKTIKPQAIVLHHTAGSYNGSVAWCMNPASRVSYHCIIKENGERTVLADDNERAWHAGVSSWRNRNDLNSWSIGLAFEGDTNNRELNANEMESAAQYLVPIMQKYGLKIADVTDHRTVSPNRKDDLNVRQYRAFTTFLKNRMA